MSQQNGLIGRTFFKKGGQDQSPGFLAFKLSALVGGGAVVLGLALLGTAWWSWSVPRQAQAQVPVDDVLAPFTQSFELAERILIFNIPVSLRELVTMAALTVEGESIFGGPVTFDNSVLFDGSISLGGNVSGEGININVGPGEITASNVVYTVEAGDGIEVSDGQNPVITNSDRGSSQNIFKQIKVGDEIIEADENNDELEFAAGTNISLDRDGDKITVNSSIELAFVVSGSNAVLGTSITRVGIGTNTPTNTLEINSGTSNASGVTLSQLTSSSPAGVGGGKVLSVDSGGRIILVEDQTGEVPDAEEVLPSATSGMTLYFNGLEWVASDNLYHDGGKVGISTNTPDGRVHIMANAASTVGLVVQASDSQTAALQEWRDESGSVLSYIDANGIFNGEANLSGDFEGNVDLGLTSGTVVFQGGSGLTGDASNLFWNNADTRLGIGTNAPTHRLTVSGGGTNTALITTNIASAPSLGGQALKVHAATSTTNAPVFTVHSNVGSSGAEKFRIQADGNVGIGITAPAEKLHLQDSSTRGAVQIGSYTSLGLVFSSAATVLGSNVKPAPDGTNAMHIMTTHATFGARAIYMTDEIGITFHTSDGSVTAGDAFSSERMRIDENGNVGIGETNPNARFVVSANPGTTNSLIHASTSTGIVQIGDTVSGNDSTLTVHGTGVRTVLQGNAAAGWLYFSQNAASAAPRIFGHTNNGFQFSTTSFGDVMRIADQGWVKIGAAGGSTPAGVLHVAGGSATNPAAIVNQTLGGSIFTASASGTPRFTVANNGNVSVHSGQLILPSGSSAAPSIVSQSLTTTGIHFPNTGTRPVITTIDSVDTFQVDAGAVRVGRQFPLVFANSSSGTGVNSNTDPALRYEAAGTLGLRTSLASSQAMRFNMYKTYTDASNYERLGIFADGGNNVFRIDPEAAGSGTVRNLAMMVSGGNLGIGVLAPTSKLRVHLDNTTSSPTMSISRNLAAGVGDYLPNADFGSGGNGGLRISHDPSGRSAFTTWTIYDVDEDRWESQATTTVGATQILFGTNGSIQFNTSASTAVTAGDPISFSNALTLIGSGNVGIGTTSPTSAKLVIPTSSGVAAIDIGSGYIMADEMRHNLSQGALIRGPQTATAQLRIGATAVISQTSGERHFLQLSNTFAPTSGTAVQNAIAIIHEVNQTGGANGITRGVYINPTLTAAADWRSIDIANNSGYALYQSGSSAQNYFAGRTGFGTTPTSDRLLNISAGSSITSGTDYGVFAQYSNGVAGSQSGYAFLGTSIAGGNNQTGTYYGVYGRAQKQNTGTLSNAYGVVGNVLANGGGTITSGAALVTRIDLANSSTITNGYGLFVQSPGISSSTLTNNYGIYIQNQTQGSTNYAVYTNSGLNRLGDQLAIIGSADRVQQIVRANGTQTTNLAEWQNNAGTALAGMNVNGHLALGQNALSGIATSVLAASEITNDTSNNRHGSLSGISFSGTTNSAQQYKGALITSGTQSASSGDLTSSFGGLVGVEASAAHSGTGTVTNSFAGSFGLTGRNITNAHAVIVTNSSVSSGNTWTNWYGMSVFQPGGAGSITNAYGLYLSDITKGGTTNYSLVTNAGNIVFNEGGDANTDFRVEGDTNANLLFVDASTDRVGIKTASPNYDLEVGGTAYLTGALRMGGGSAALALSSSDATLLNVGFGFSALNFGNGKAYLGSNRNFGVGTLNPGYRLDIRTDQAASFSAFFVNDGNNEDRNGIRIQAGADDGSGTTSYIEALDGDGDVVGRLQNSSGTFGVFDVSDARTKTNIADTALGGLEIISGLRVVDFNRASNPNGMRITGFIAQEVQQIFPNMVAEGNDGLLSINKDALIPVLTKAVQEQQLQITALGSLGAQQTATEGNAQDITELRALMETSNLWSASDSAEIAGIARWSNGVWYNLAQAIFEKPVELLASLRVNGPVWFGDRVVYADSDRAGFATITAGSEQVEVRFEQAYAETPVITATLRSGSKLDWFQVANESSTGFSLVISAPAEQDIEFAWSAVAVENPSHTRSTAVESLQLPESQEEEQPELIEEPDLIFASPSPTPDANVSIPESTASAGVEGQL